MSEIQSKTKQVLYRNPWKNGQFANAKCFCFSGKKLKKCHGEEYVLTDEEMRKSQELFQVWERSEAAIPFHAKGGDK